jgi:hypothetical protein
MPAPNYALGALSNSMVAEEKLEKADKDDQQSDDEILQRLTEMTKDDLKAIRKKTADMLQKAQDKWRVQVDGDQRKLPEFEAGDFVLLKNMRAKTNHFQPLYLGPYRVLERKSPILYVIKREEPHFKRDNYMDVVHIDRMKHYHFDPRTPVQPIYQVEEEEEDDMEEEEAASQLWIPAEGDDLQEKMTRQLRSHTRKTNENRVPDPVAKVTKDVGSSNTPAAVTRSDEPEVTHKGPVTRSMVKTLKDQVKTKWKKIWKPKVHWIWVETLSN